jgi:hypothetical protein
MGRRSRRALYAAAPSRCRCFTISNHPYTGWTMPCCQPTKGRRHPGPRTVTMPGWQVSNGVHARFDVADGTAVHERWRRAVWYLDNSHLETAAWHAGSALDELAAS